MAEFLMGKVTILAPLVGGSDLSYRLLARHYGANVTVTPMNVCETYLDEMKARNEGSKRKRNPKFMIYQFHKSDRPLLLQLAGTTAPPIVEVANLPLFNGHVDGIDLNLGCPQSFAMRKPVGAGLPVHRDYGLAYTVEMVKEVVKGVPRLPVTVKLRLVESVETTIKFCQSLVHDAGVKGITVHGRYYHQKGSLRGECDWEAIRRIREALPAHIPVVGNGDVRTPEQLADRLANSSCDAVMCGYGALRNPSVFRMTAAQPEEPLAGRLTNYFAIAVVHERRLLAFQKHIHWMCKEYPGVTNEWKASLFQAQSLRTVVELAKRIAPEFSAPPIPDELNASLVGVPQQTVNKRKRRKMEKQKSKPQKQ